MTRAIIAGSGSEIACNLVTNEMLARIMDTSDAWIRERTGVETRYFVDPGTSTTDLGAAAAARALEAARLRPGRRRHGRVRDDDAGPPVSRVRRPAAGADGPPPRPVLRHPPAVQRVSLWTAARRRADSRRRRADHPARRVGGALRIHAVVARLLGAPLRRRRRRRHRRGMGGQHEDAPPERALRRRGRGRRGAGARRAGSRRDRLAPRRRRQRGRQAVGAGRRLRAAALRGSRADRRARIRAVDGRPRRLQDGDGAGWPRRRAR